MYLIVFMSLFISCQDNRIINVWNEQREIDLIEGIDKSDTEIFKYLNNNLIKWSKQMNVPKPELFLYLKNRYNGKYLNNKIQIDYTEELYEFKYLNVTLAHEFAHYYFDYKNIKFKNRFDEEIKADLFALDLVKKKDMIDLIKKMNFLMKSDTHPDKDKRLKIIRSYRSKINF